MKPPTRGARCAALVNDWTDWRDQGTSWDRCCEAGSGARSDRGRAGGQTDKDGQSEVTGQGFEGVRRGCVTADTRGVLIVLKCRYFGALSNCDANLVPICRQSSLCTLRHLKIVANST